MVSIAVVRFRLLYVTTAIAVDEEGGREVDELLLIMDDDEW